MTQTKTTAARPGLLGVTDDVSTICELLEKARLMAEDLLQDFFNLEGDDVEPDGEMVPTMKGGKFTPAARVLMGYGTAKTRAEILHDYLARAHNELLGDYLWLCMMGQEKATAKAAAHRAEEG